MTDRAFALDITTRDANGDAMWHARGDNAAEFAYNVAELIRMQPHLAGFVSNTGRGIAPAPQGSRDMTPTAITARAAEVEPVCPEHGEARPSKFGGVYCTSANGDGTFCPWKVGKKKATAA